MKHSEYRSVCARTEHKDQSVRLHNLKTGEEGTILQCSVTDYPETILVRTGKEITTWYPEDVQEAKD